MDPVDGGIFTYQVSFYWQLVPSSECSFELGIVNTANNFDRFICGKKLFYLFFGKVAVMFHALINVRVGRRSATPPK